MSACTVCLREIYLVLYLCKVTQLFCTVVLFTMEFFPQLKETSEENIFFGKR